MVFNDSPARIIIIVLALPGMELTFPMAVPQGCVGIGGYRGVGDTAGF